MSAKFPRGVGGAGPFLARSLPAKFQKDPGKIVKGVAFIRLLVSIWFGGSLA